MTDLQSTLDAARSSGTPVVREIGAPGDRVLYAGVSPIQDVGWAVVMQDISPLKELDRLRTEWVAAVSHDLKNPITAMQISAGLMDRAGPLTDMQRDLLEKMQHSGERLRSLVTDVLDLARLEAGPSLRATAVRPASVVAEAMAEVESLASQKSMTLVTDLSSDLPQALGDASLLARALVNLLSNAVKYTPERGQVTVRAHPQDGELCFEIIDNGPGIRPEAQTRLFEPFYRVSDASEAIEGTGLGLNIVKTIVEKHGGRVWVESEFGVGSTFAFAVPIAGEGE
jgi:signal transduction histidine kinase